MSFASLENVVILPIPITLKKIKALENLINVNLQRYLTEIIKDDFIKLTHVHSQNNQFLASKDFHHLIKK